MKLGLYVKTIQFSVIAYDVFVVQKFSMIGQFSRLMNILELAFCWTTGGALFAFVVGQTLNVATFWALGLKGVYYGNELGYEVRRVESFPYNLGIRDPQYWGVVLSIFGLYGMLQLPNFFVPALELFWYLMSMYLLEHSANGKYVLKSCCRKQHSQSI